MLNGPGLKGKSFLLLISKVIRGLSDEHEEGQEWNIGF